MPAAQALRDGAITRERFAAIGAEPKEGGGALLQRLITDATATWGELLRGLAIPPEQGGVDDPTRPARSRSDRRCGRLRARMGFRNRRVRSRRARITTEALVMGARGGPARACRHTQRVG
jgi:hypothetical protein